MSTHNKYKSSKHISFRKTQQMTKNVIKSNLFYYNSFIISVLSLLRFCCVFVAKCHFLRNSCAIRNITNNANATIVFLPSFVAFLNICISVNYKNVAPVASVARKKHIPE
jgi:hypothetical protein